MIMSIKTLTQFQGSEISPGLFQDFIDGYITLSPLAVESGYDCGFAIKMIPD